MTQPAFVNPQFYGNNLVSDVPAMLCSGVGAVPRATNHRIVVATSTTASQTSGGVSVINLQGNGYLKTGSCYLKIKGSVTTTADAGADSDLRFGNMTKSLSSIINRLTLSSNGTQLETINNFSVVEPQLVMQASNSGYFLNDYCMMERANLTATGCLNTARNIAAIPFSGCIPLIFGCLNSSQSWNLSLAPLQVQIDYNSVGVAFTQTTGGVPTEFNVSSCQIVYENIQVEQNMLEAIKMEMASVPYTIPFSSVMCFTKACEATCLYNIGVNFTSANGVFLCHSAPKTLGIVQKFKSNSQTDFSVYNDNQLVNTTGTLSCADNISSVYCEMQRAFACLQDTQVTSAFSVTGLPAVSSVYESDQFLAGISLNRFNESFNLSGTSVKQLTIGNSCTVTPNDITYIMITYSGYITIDQFNVVSRYI